MNIHINYQITDYGIDFEISIDMDPFHKQGIVLINYVDKIVKIVI